MSNEMLVSYHTGIYVELSPEALVGLYLGNMSHHPVLLWAVVALLLVGNEASHIAQAWWMGLWASQYETRPPSGISASL